MSRTKLRYDAVIIGAGIIGCSIALSLNRRGFTTLNVDGLPAAGYGSTSHSAGIIRPYYSTIDGTALAMEGHYHWANWTDFLGYEPAGELRYDQCGCLVLATAENENLAFTRSILEEAEVPFEAIAAADLKDWLPSADLRSFGPPRLIDDPGFGESNGRQLTGAVFCPTGGYVSDPQLACRHIAAAVSTVGGDFLYSDTAVEILGAGSSVKGVVMRSGAVVSSPIVVNAAGPSSANINALADATRPGQIATRALRQEVVHLKMPYAGGRAALPCVLTDSDCGVYMRPEVGGHILIGSLEPACDTLEFVSPDHFNDALSEQWNNQAWRAALRFPSLDIPNNGSGIVALYDVSSDWIPIYDRSDVDGFFMAIGTSGNQFKNAPVVGEIMAELITYVQSGRDHDKDPLRFRLKHSSREINTGTFSRLRAITAESSFSVLG